MERKINRVKIFCNDNEKSNKVYVALKNELIKFKFEVVEELPYDLAISIGGDGSFLRMVKKTNFLNNIYYIGVNSGTLGFLQEIDINNMHDFVSRLNSNLYKVDEINIEENNIITSRGNYKFNSLNEIVIRNSNFNMLRIPIYVDNELLEEFSGDGVLISTSTGSTAYNMSFKGSIVYNTLNTLSITPIAPLNNKVFKTLLSSVIVPGDKIISLVPLESYKNLFIQIDGVNRVFHDVERIESKISSKKIKCLRMNEYHFIKIVNDKLLG